MYSVSVRTDFIAQHFLIGGDWGPENERNSHHYVLELTLATIGARMDGLAGVSAGYVAALCLEAVFMLRPVYRAARRPADWDNPSSRQPRETLVRATRAPTGEGGFSHGDPGYEAAPARNR